MIEETIKALIAPINNNTYIGEAPIDVDSCQWLRASSGTSLNHFDKETYDYPQYSIFVRGSSNREAKERTESIYRALRNFTGSGFVIITRQLPRFVGKDKKNRAIYSFRIEYQLGGY